LNFLKRSRYRKNNKKVKWKKKAFKKKKLRKKKKIKKKINLLEIMTKAKIIAIMRQKRKSKMKLILKNVEKNLLVIIYFAILVIKIRINYSQIYIVMMNQLIKFFVKYVLHKD